MSHDRSNPGGFAFKEDPRTGVYSCVHVKDGAPILYVTHDREGDWQFLCGRTHDPSEGILVCLSEAVAWEPSLNSLAGLRRGHRAERKYTSQPWKLIDPVDEHIARHVRDTGWAVQLIPEDESGPGFAYTTGLFHNYGHAELIIFGLAVEDMHAVLNDCGELVKSGRKLEPGQKLGGILGEGYDVLFREVKAPQSYDQHVTYTKAFYKGRDFPLLQVVWPDARGRFPGGSQPLLP
jgi:hypothetical protein